MTLDLPTVIALTALSAFLMGASIFLAGLTQSNSDPSMKSLGQGCLSQSLGWILIGLRDRIPDALSIFGGNWALLVSGLCYVRAVNVFLDSTSGAHRPTLGWISTLLWPTAMLSTLALGYFSFGRPDIAARIAVSSLTHAVLGALCALRLLRGHLLPKSQRIVGIGFALAALAQVFRLTANYLNPPRSPDLFVVITSQTATILMGHVAVVMLSFLFVLMVHDRAARELQDLATHDHLTGVFNRSAFEGYARHAIETARRSGDSLSLLLFDVDHFKNINDTLGHLTGDVALRALARLTEANLRSQDVFGRYGGEEFAVLLPSTDAEGAFLVAERIRESVAATEFRDDSQTFRLTLSLGIAQFATGGELATEQRLTDLFRAADTALYEAKRAGRNQTLIATPDAESEAESAL